jgi:hypothetical protein
MRLLSSISDLMVLSLVFFALFCAVLRDLAAVGAALLF